MLFRSDSEVCALAYLVVVQVFCDATYTVAAHLCLRAVAVEDAHAVVGLVAWLDDEDAIGTHAGVSTAGLDGELRQVVDSVEYKYRKGTSNREGVSFIYEGRTFSGSKVDRNMLIGCLGRAWNKED